MRRYDYNTDLRTIGYDFANYMIEEKDFVDCNATKEEYYKMFIEYHNALVDYYYKDNKTARKNINKIYTNFINEHNIDGVSLIQRMIWYIGDAFYYVDDIFTFKRAYYFDIVGITEL